MASHQLSSISAFFPCLNEEANIIPLTQELTQVLTQITSQYEIIIINDGSVDRSAQIATELTQKDPHIRLISHPKNLGYGASIQSGLKAAHFDWIFFTDGDRQFHLQELLEFIPHTNTHQVVIGYRVKRADGNLRALNAKIFKLFIDILFRVHVKDIDCAFKLLHTSAVKPLLPLHSTGAMVSSELLYRLKKRGVKFKQLPVTHLPRTQGIPTGNNPKVILKAGFEALKLYVGMKFKRLTI